MVTTCSRQTEDLTVDKTDEKDAVLIARLTAQLRCYVPEPVDQNVGPTTAFGVVPAVSSWSPRLPGRTLMRDGTWLT